MNTLFSGLANGKSSAAGAVAGGSLILFSMDQPDFHRMLVGVLAGIALVAMGLFTKDATTGSQPGESR